MNRLIVHLSTITRHKMKVSALCFRCGLYAQGIATIFQNTPSSFAQASVIIRATASPIDREKEVQGIFDGMAAPQRDETCTIGNTGWITVQKTCIHPLEMPVHYVVEMFCDRVAASQIYMKDRYDDCSALNYYLNGREQC